MIPCEHALSRLWEYLDGELPSSEDEAVRAHLAVCSRCYPEYDFQRAYFEFTRRIRDSEHAPPELRRRVFQVILAEERNGGTE